MSLKSGAGASILPSSGAPAGVGKPGSWSPSIGDGVGDGVGLKNDKGGNPKSLKSGVGAGAGVGLNDEKGGKLISLEIGVGAGEGDVGIIINLLFLASICTNGVEITKNRMHTTCLIKCPIVKQIEYWGVLVNFLVLMKSLYKVIKNAILWFNSSFFRDDVRRLRNCGENFSVICGVGKIMAFGACCMCYFIKNV